MHATIFATDVAKLPFALFQTGLVDVLGFNFVPEMFLKRLVCADPIINILLHISIGTIASLFKQARFILQKVL